MFPGNQDGLLLQQPLGQLSIAGSEQSQEVMSGYIPVTTLRLGDSLNLVVNTSTEFSSNALGSPGLTQMLASSVPWATEVPQTPPENCGIYYALDNPHALLQS